MLRVRPRDLPGLHDLRPGGDPLPGPRTHGRQGRGAETRRAERIEIRIAVRTDRDVDADRDQRRGLPARAADGRRPQRASPAGSTSTASSSRAPSTRRGRSSASPKASGGASSRRAFLHYGPLHLGMNMLVLWFIGPPARGVLRPLRATCSSTSSPGSPDRPARSSGRRTRSPSGRPARSSGSWAPRSSSRRAGSTSSAARRMGLVVINLVITFVIPGISIGGHIGGLIGGGPVRACVLEPPALACARDAVDGRRRRAERRRRRRTGRLSSLSRRSRPP